MPCDPLGLTIRFLSVAFGLAAIWFPPDPDDFPFYGRLFPKQATRRNGMETLYKTRRGILEQGADGFSEVLETIYENIDETEIGFQPDRIVCAGTKGTGRIIDLQHWEGKRSPTQKHPVGHANRVWDWLEAETNAPSTRVSRTLGAIAVVLPIISSFI